MGNELALQGEVIDLQVKGSPLKAQKLMKQTAIDINSEMIKNCRTWTFSFNKQLEQNQQKFILKLPRQQQRMLQKI